MIILLISLIFIGVLANFFGKIAEYIKLPSLIGMILLGMIIGPAFLNIVPDITIKVAPNIKDIALIIVLFIGGLGISSTQMKKIGKPAILLSVVPAIFEGLTIAVISMYLLDFSFVQGAILGFIISAVSPAVLVPSMVELINKKLGENKSIPQMLLVGASADDTIAITLFTSFLSIYLAGQSGEKISFISQIIIIPITIILSLLTGFVISRITIIIFKYIDNEVLNIIIVLIICFLIRSIESTLKFEYCNSLLAIMVYGFFLRFYLNDFAKRLQDNLNKLWRYGKLYLFAFVGMAINPKLVGEYFFIGVIILIISLSIRSIGVLLALIGTNLNTKERIFCVIAYLPKATVQSAKASIPLQKGVAGGEIMQAIAILSVLITAPIGATLIKYTQDKFLEKS